MIDFDEVVYIIGLVILEVALLALLCLVGFGWWFWACTQQAC